MSKRNGVEESAVTLTMLEVRALYSMCGDASLPNHGYAHCVSAIKKLRDACEGPFCSEETCFAAGVVKNRRGELVCSNHTS